MYIKLRSIIRFLFFVVVTILVTYYLPVFISQAWYVLLLLLYWNSKDEPFWLVFFLVTVDGFMGFFGIFTVTIRLIPGLPAIELAQFYILLSVLKAWKEKSQPFVFYKSYLLVLVFYLMFMTVRGHILGFAGDLRDYFRIAKLTIPFLLFYSIPRLFTNLDSYKRLFAFIFIVLAFGFATQLFNLFTGHTPSEAFQLTEDQISEAGEYRGFYNVGATLMGFFGALYFLASGERKIFNPFYLYSIIISAYGMAYLSATRGWMLGFSIVIIFTFLLTLDFRKKKVAGFLIFVSFIIILGLLNNKVRKQVDFASARLETLKSVANGDITAEGTLSRLNIRGPRVMTVFWESPVFGWGFSDTSRKYADGHVGNQTLLLYSGIVGFALLVGFLSYFSMKIIQLYFQRGNRSSLKRGLLVFAIFLAGWFIIHSSSSQQFTYLGMPLQIIPQGIFFSFGALVYSKSKEAING